jgi:hypothetical protein
VSTDVRASRVTVRAGTVVAHRAEPHRVARVEVRDEFRLLVDHAAVLVFLVFLVFVVVFQILELVAVGLVVQRARAVRRGGLPSHVVVHRVGGGSGDRGKEQKWQRHQSLPT